MMMEKQKKLEHVMNCVAVIGLLHYHTFNKHMMMELVMAVSPAVLLLMKTGLVVSLELGALTLLV